MPDSYRRRAVDYLLSGTSVQSNPHLARFASAPYLDWLCSQDAFQPMLNRSSKQLRKEIIESYAVLEALEASLGRSVSQHTFIDLCAGKGFLSVVLALEFPSAFVLQVDNNPRIKTEHIAALANLRYLHADIMDTSFATMLSQELDAIHSKAPPSTRPRYVAMGIHLCGPLSPRAIELFGALDSIEALILVPCCLDRRTDGPVKAKAKILGLDPYEVKVQQLHSLLVEHTEHVHVFRDLAMRTQSGEQHHAGAKNAIMLARRHVSLVGKLMQACKGLVHGHNKGAQCTIGLEVTGGPLLLRRACCRYLLPVVAAAMIVVVKGMAMRRLALTSSPTIHGYKK